MIIKVVELCLVDCINEENEGKEGAELKAKRTVVYDSPKDTLLEAFKDYDENLESDNIIQAHDDFDGQCLDFIKYISIEEVEEL